MVEYIVAIDVTRVDSRLMHSEFIYAPTNFQNRQKNKLLHAYTDCGKILGKCLHMCTNARDVAHQ